MKTTTLTTNILDPWAELPAYTEADDRRLNRLGYDSLAQYEQAQPVTDPWASIL